jgi:hypothetical protein
MKDEGVRQKVYNFFRQVLGGSLKGSYMLNS